MSCLGKTEWEEDKLECYYTSRKRYQHMNYSYRRKQIGITVTIEVVYRCPNTTNQNNEKIHNAITEVSKGDCIRMGDFNQGNIKWDAQQSRRPNVLSLVQDNFLTRHVLEPTRAARVLDIVLFSQK